MDHLWTRCFHGLEGSPSLDLGALRRAETLQGRARGWSEGSQGQTWGGGHGQPGLRRGRVQAECPSRQQASLVQSRAIWEAEQSGIAEPQPGWGTLLVAGSCLVQAACPRSGGTSQKRSGEEGMQGSPPVKAELWPCQGSNPVSEPLLPRKGRSGGQTPIALCPQAPRSRWLPLPPDQSQGIHQRFSTPSALHETPQLFTSLGSALNHSSPPKPPPHPVQISRAPGRFPDVLRTSLGPGGQRALLCWLGSSPCSAT